jgi:hypothetical protein
VCCTIIVLALMCTTPHACSYNDLFAGAGALVYDYEELLDAPAAGARTVLPARMWSADFLLPATRHNERDEMLRNSVHPDTGVWIPATRLLITLVGKLQQASVLRIRTKFSPRELSLLMRLIPMALSNERTGDLLREVKKNFGGDELHVDARGVRQAIAAQVWLPRFQRTYDVSAARCDIQELRVTFNHPVLALIRTMYTSEGVQRPLTEFVIGYQPNAGGRLGSGWACGADAKECAEGCPVGYTPWPLGKAQDGVQLTSNARHSAKPVSFTNLLFHPQVIRKLGSQARFTVAVLGKLPANKRRRSTKEFRDCNAHTQDAISRDIQDIFKPFSEPPGITMTWGEEDVHFLLRLVVNNVDYVEEREMCGMFTGCTKSIRPCSNCLSEKPDLLRWEVPVVERDQGYVQMVISRLQSPPEDAVDEAGTVCREEEASLREELRQLSVHPMALSMWDGGSFTNWMSRISGCYSLVAYDPLHFWAHGVLEYMKSITRLHLLFSARSLRKVSERIRDVACVQGVGSWTWRHLSDCFDAPKLDGGECTQIAMLMPFGLGGKLNVIVRSAGNAGERDAVRQGLVDMYQSAHTLYLLMRCEVLRTGPEFARLLDPAAQTLLTAMQCLCHRDPTHPTTEPMFSLYNTIKAHGLKHITDQLVRFGCFDVFNTAFDEAQHRHLKGLWGSVTRHRQKYHNALLEVGETMRLLEDAAPPKLPKRAYNRITDTTMWRNTYLRGAGVELDMAPNVPASRASEQDATALPHHVHVSRSRFKRLLLNYLHPELQGDINCAAARELFRRVTAHFHLTAVIQQEGERTAAVHANAQKGKFSFVRLHSEDDHAYLVRAAAFVCICHIDPPADRDEGSDTDTQLFLLGVEMEPHEDAILDLADNTPRHPTWTQHFALWQERRDRGLPWYCLHSLDSIQRLAAVGRDEDFGDVAYMELLHFPGSGF